MLYFKKVNEIKLHTWNLHKKNKKHEDLIVYFFMVGLDNLGLVGKQEPRNQFILALLSSLLTNVNYIISRYYGQNIKYYAGLQNLNEFCKFY